VGTLQELEEIRYPYVSGNVQKIQFKWQNFARLWMSAVLLLADLISISLAGFLAIEARLAFGETGHFEVYSQTLLVALLCLAGYALQGLYPGIGLGFVIELKRLTIITSLVIFSLGGLTFFLRNPENYSRLTLGLTWFFSLALVPSGRAIARALGSRLHLWGEPVVVIGYGKQGHRLIDTLQKNRQIGLLPVMALDGSGAENDRVEGGIPVFPAQEAFDRDIPGLIGVKTALLILAEVPISMEKAIVGNQLGRFRHIILIQNLESINSFGITPLIMDNVLCLEVRQNLFNPWIHGLKRVMDIGLILISSWFILPITVLIALLIWLDTGNPIIYKQERIGKGGEKIKIWKFRTMVPNADRNQESYFRQHPELRIEWESTQKIKEDPRVTRIGKLLRRISLDELPQIWNVLKGEMSLVGPRPIVRKEISQYGHSFPLYNCVRPGLTGLWQVSGRNNLPYCERVRLDEIYVRNWSIWLDITILLRTILVVLRCDGAY
jgi:Undecaprenyl-phosphate galactose phosphotransferase WbaP